MSTFKTTTPTSALLKVYENGRWSTEPHWWGPETASEEEALKAAGLTHHADIHLDDHASPLYQTITVYRGEDGRYLVTATTAWDEIDEVACASLPDMIAVVGLFRSQAGPQQVVLSGAGFYGGDRIVAVVHDEGGDFRPVMEVIGNGLHKLREVEPVMARDVRRG